MAETIFNFMLPFSSVARGCYWPEQASISQSEKELGLTHLSKLTMLLFLQAQKNPFGVKVRSKPDYVILMRTCCSILAIAFTATLIHVPTHVLNEYLFKHMIGKVAPNGEDMFCRRHNTDRTMVYWHESADLVNVWEKAGVKDPYWNPPPGWTPVVKADANGCITGASGISLVVNPSWTNPTGEWNVGYKFVYELFTSSLTSHLKKERKKKCDEKNQEAIAKAVKNLNQFDQAISITRGREAGYNSHGYDVKTTNILLDESCVAKMAISGCQKMVRDLIILMGNNLRADVANNPLDSRFIRVVNFHLEKYPPFSLSLKPHSYGTS
ncbi:hypothetical protein IFM89_032258 [Coptis chinensis]|uniref:Uncharacterized protein n=1 Tax=Coptis chinensis TaxID=261450 RepID=A0A835IGK3_9MAGN|nr:hypothetical protein IFM89_032258 [Coptis chinensis]